MKNKITKDKTLKYYDENAKVWGESHGGFDEESFWKEEMQKFNELLPKGKVIEIGSGTGKDASCLIKLGYDYVGTDASIGLLKVAKERNPNNDFRCIKVQDIANEFSSGEFDGFWTAATLLHIPKKEIDSSLSSINHVIRMGGIGFVTVKQGSGEIEDETGRLFTYYSQDEFAELLVKHGFEVLYKDIQKMSEKTTWLIYLVKKVK